MDNTAIIIIATCSGIVLYLLLLSHYSSGKETKHNKEVTMEDKGLKFYVWENVLCNYACGVAFAFASNPDEARKLVEADFKRRYSDPWFLANGYLDFLSNEPTIVHSGKFGFAFIGSD